nr:SH3 domain-containing protein [uncultured Roseibium sp.]
MRVLVSAFLIVICLIHQGFAQSVYKVQRDTHLNARSGPGKNFGVVERLAPGTKLSELERDGSWSKVSTPQGSEVWVHNGFLELSKEQKSNPSFYPEMELRLALGHGADVESVALSPDGRYFLTGGGTNAPLLWEAQSGREIRRFVGHSEAVRSVAFSPDGRYVLTGSDDDTARLWELETGREVQVYKGHSENILNVAFSEDGRFVLTAGLDNTVRSWSKQTGSVYSTIEPDFSFGRAAFSSNGKHVLLAGFFNSSALLLDVSTGETIARFEGASGAVASVALSKNGKYAAMLNHVATSLWEVATGQEIKRFNHKPGYAISVPLAFSPDSRFLLNGTTDGTAGLWDITADREIHRFDSQTFDFRFAAFSHDGRYLLTGNSDSTGSLWELESGKEKKRYESRSFAVHEAAFSPDGKFLLVGSKDDKAHLWDWQLGKHVREFAGHTKGVFSVAFSPDGNQVLTGGYDAARLWETDTAREVKRFTGHAGEVISVAFGFDGRLALTATSSAAHLWETDTAREIRQFRKQEERISGAALSPDGARVLTGLMYTTQSDTTVARLWDVETGSETQAFDLSPGSLATTWSAAFSPDGQQVLTANFDRAQFWGTETGLKTETFGDQKSGVISVAFEKNGDFILTGGLDGTTRLLALKTDQEDAFFQAGMGYVVSVAVNPAGRQILTGSSDGTTRLWDIDNGDELAKFITFKDGSWIVMTPEGFFNASEGGAKHINVVRGLEVFSVDQVYDALYRPDLVREALAGDPDGKVAAAAAELDLEKIIEGGFPPRVSLISPEPDETIVGDGSGSGAVDVEVEIKATSGGIGKVEWSVNGVLQDLSERALAPLVLADGVEEAGGESTVGESKRVTQSLYLAPGENEIQVVAYNAAGLIASDPLTFTVTLDEPEITDPKLYVLSVGVNDYFDSRLDLTYAASDAKAIGSALEVAGKEIYSDIIVETVLDEDVTKEGLEAAFERLEEKVRPGDVFVFFLAGHGKTEDGRYYFLPHDFRYSDEGSFKTAGIGQEVMQEWFSRIRAQKSVLLFDTCESGTLTQEPVVRGTEALAAISRLNRAIGRTTLTASTDTAPALEGFRGHGLFTYTLLDAIAAADNDNDSAVDVTELASYIDRRLPEYSEAAFGYTQVPQMKVVGNTFPVAKATFVLSDEPAEIIPTTPTHVVIQPTNILAEAVNEATVVMELKPGAAVRLISSEDGWSLIARDGKELGFVVSEAISSLY